MRALLQTYADSKGDPAAADVGGGEGARQSVTLTFGLKVPNALPNFTSRPEPRGRGQSGKNKRVHRQIKLLFRDMALLALSPPKFACARAIMSSHAKNVTRRINKARAPLLIRLVRLPLLLTSVLLRPALIIPVSSFSLLLPLSLSLSLSPPPVSRIDPAWHFGRNNRAQLRFRRRP